MATKIGQLRDHFEVQVATETKDPTGFRTTTWETDTSLGDQGRIWGRLEPLAGKEQDFAKAFSATVNYRVTIRALPALLPTHKLKLGTRIFSIDAILPLEDRTYYQLACTESVAG